TGPRSNDGTFGVYAAAEPLPTRHPANSSLYMYRGPPRTPLFPYTTLFRSRGLPGPPPRVGRRPPARARPDPRRGGAARAPRRGRSEEHTSELQSLTNLVCRLLLEKKKTPSKPIAGHGIRACLETGPVNSTS